MSTKLHLARDGKARPLSVVLTAGQRLLESTQLEAVLDAIRVPGSARCAHASARGG